MIRERTTPLFPREGSGEPWTRIEIRDRTNAAHIPQPRPQQLVPRPPPFQSILVPIDGSREAEHAIPYALALAQGSGAKVTLASIFSTVQVANDPGRFGWFEGDYQLERLRAYQDTLTARVSDASPVRIDTVLRRGRWPEDDLCELGDWDADLIVLAARRRGWWSRVWRGSISGQIACRSRNPVLFVQAPAGPPDFAMRPRLGRVLVPLDGTPRADRGLEPAAKLAGLMESQCELLHVVRRRPYSVDWSLAYCGTPDRPDVRRAREAEQYLHHVAHGLRDMSLSARSRVISSDRSAEDVIVQYARQSGADLIAMASRGGVGLKGLFFGSLAVRVARRATVPVLIGRSQ